MQFLTLYPTNFTALDEMLEPVRWAGSPTCSNWRAYSRYQANPKVIRINQDVPTLTSMLCNGVAYQ